MALRDKRSLRSMVSITTGAPAAAGTIATHDRAACDAILKTRYAHHGIGTADVHVIKRIILAGRTH